ncbi:MAG: PLDc N-terminal domain-containing protein [Alphaproteobacteria bacterium]|nr:PLDc N-terminal domain-containing protein [Alphaproteobacteria bacterium]
MIETINTYWPLAASILVAIVAVVLVVSVILHKRDESAAIAWVGLILLAPVVGAIAYLLFGINRIRRRAMRTRPRTSTPADWDPARAAREPLRVTLDELDPASPLFARRKLIDALTTFSPVEGNSIGVLRNGDDAYSAMLAAIDNAERSVALASYIFKSDDAGMRFVEALERAQKRGVEVRVLVDGAGLFYSLPTISSVLAARGVTHARYLHSFWPWRMPYLNLRNHRKILVVDGRIGFAGGINISAANLISQNPSRPVRDLHFSFEGPVVSQLMETFADDWAFATREVLGGQLWFPAPATSGNTLARAIPSGPHEPIDRMRWILHAAISQAQRRICVMTPYLLPDQIIVAELRLAAIRGVSIDIVIPEHSNLFFVDWAVRARLDELLVDGCRLWFGPRPFNHAKLMLVDDDWAMVGSSNWDPRSLRLNFELNVECQSEDLVSALDDIFERERADARAVSLEEVRNRRMPVRLRDGVARLFSPYL